MRRTPALRLLGGRIAQGRKGTRLDHDALPGRLGLRGPMRRAVRHRGRRPARRALGACATQPPVRHRLPGKVPRDRPGSRRPGGLPDAVAQRNAALVVAAVPRNIRHRSLFRQRRARVGISVRPFGSRCRPGSTHVGSAAHPRLPAAYSRRRLADRRHRATEIVAGQRISETGGAVADSAQHSAFHHEVRNVEDGHPGHAPGATG